MNVTFSPTAITAAANALYLNKAFTCFPAVGVGLSASSSLAQWVGAEVFSGSTSYRKAVAPTTGSITANVHNSTPIVVTLDAVAAITFDTLVLVRDMLVRPILTVTNVNTSTEYLTVSSAGSFVEGDTVIWRGQNLPGGAAYGSPYTIFNLSGNTFQLKDVANSVVNFTSAGSGTLQLLSASGAVESIKTLPSTIILATGESAAFMAKFSVG